MYESTKWTKMNLLSSFKITFELQYVFYVSFSKLVPVFFAVDLVSYLERPPEHKYKNI